MADNGHSQGTDAVPINRPSITPEERLDYTRGLLEGVRFPQPMPADFDPTLATPDQLAQYGLPPRPSADDTPQDLSRWEKMVTELKGKELVRPSFKIIQRDITTRTRDRYEAQKWKKTNWAGAVISDFVLNLVESNWTVPRPEPGRGDHTAWYSAAYVGLDGYRMDSNDVLAGGTGHDYYKAKKGFYQTYAWFEWYPAYPVELDGFPIMPSDRVLCGVLGDLPRDDKKGAFFISNDTTGKYASFSFSAPPGVSLRGDSAEWIVEGEEPEANFYVVGFDQCRAQNTNRRWYNLSSATTVMSTCEDGTVCTATIEDDETVIVRYRGARDK